jgi:hypothetical protein
MKGVNKMEWNSHTYYEINRLLREQGVQRTQPAPRHGSAGARKWKDQMGPNPLMMMGLDRS